MHPDTLQAANRPLFIVRAGAAPQPAASLERAGGGTPGESVMLRSTTGDAMSDVRDAETAAAAGDAGSSEDGGGGGSGSSAYTTWSPFVEVAVMLVTRYPSGTVVVVVTLLAAATTQVSPRARQQNPRSMAVVCTDSQIHLPRP